MKSNYCELKKNNIYREIYDELLDEELNMNNPSHNDKIKHWIEKKINSSDYVVLSNIFTNKENLLEDLILKISHDANNPNIQGNTILMYANDNSMYELFYMEDLTKKISDSELNEFCSITNIFLQPVYWTCGVLKSNYDNGKKIYLDTVTKSDIAKLFIQNFYHQGVMINPDGTIIEIEFTGENPLQMIGNNFVMTNKIDLFGFNIVPWIEKTNNSQEHTQLNETVSKLFGYEIYGRVFMCIVCPNTNKKFWDITKMTIKNILKIIDNNEIREKIQKDIEQSDINANPFYFIKKNLNN
jgi:hypothetical protein